LPSCWLGIMGLFQLAGSADMLGERQKGSKPFPTLQMPRNNITPHYCM
jgi:hypothetical protein